MSADAERALFDACVAVAPGAPREALLAQCSDLGLAARVRRLLAAHDDDASLRPALAWPAAPAVEVPERIGAYRILERIGEGAMGEVWLAEQQEPVRRRVALKLLRPGLGTRDVLARFDLERQALALMTHPNVARILDAGATADGRPFFAMEYVPGVALTRFCDERQLGLDARLALLGDVCAGVHHAHLRGVIHRDLKPSNILVAEVDGELVPKIIDFGIAKATSVTLDPADAHTRLGHVLGTPDYMSPEQAWLSPLDVDARTDVYSLGVLLYEVLTGERPYQLPRDAVDARTLGGEILAQEILRPSERVSRRSDDALARRRGLTRRQLATRLAADLDWIALKALEKDRARRYGSVSELSGDLQRYRQHEPVSAGPPSAAYRARKFVRRHRIGVAAVSGLVVASLVFGTGMAWLAQRATVERDRANREAELARQVTAFTAGLFELANPSRVGAHEVSARELLDIGVRRLDLEPALGRDDVRAALLESAGSAYRGLGDYARAAPLLEQSVQLRLRGREAAPGAYAQALLSLAQLAREQGDYPRAEVLLLDARAPLRDAAGTTAQSLSRIELELATVLRMQSKLPEAAALARDRGRACEAATPPDAGCAAKAQAILGRTLMDQGDLRAAERELSAAVPRLAAALGRGHDWTLEALDGLAIVLVNQSRSAEAEPLLREIVETSRRTYGPRHQAVAVALSNLGNALSDDPGRLREAERAYDEAIAILRAAQLGDNPELATALNNAGFVYSRQQRWSKARDVYREAAAIRVTALGADHPDTIGAEVGEALALNKLGRFAEAEGILRRACAAYVRTLGADHWRTANAEQYLGMVLVNRGRSVEAEATLRSALGKLTAALGTDNIRTQSARRALEELQAGRRAAR